MNSASKKEERGCSLRIKSLEFEVGVGDEEEKEKPGAKKTRLSAG